MADRLQGISISEADFISMLQSFVSEGNVTKKVNIEVKGAKEGAKEVGNMADALEKLNSVKPDAFTDQLKEISSLVSGNRFKGVNLNQFTSQLIQAFSDPAKSAQELVEIINNVHENLVTLSKIPNSGSFVGFNESAINKAIQKQKRINDLEQQYEDKKSSAKSEARGMKRSVDILSEAKKRKIQRVSHSDVAESLNIDKSGINVQNGDDSLLSTYRRTADVLQKMIESRKEYNKLNSRNVGDYVQQEQDILSVFQQLQQIEARVSDKFAIDPKNLLSSQFRDKDGRFNFSENVNKAINAYAEQMTSSLRTSLDRAKNDLADHLARSVDKTAANIEQSGQTIINGRAVKSNRRSSGVNGRETGVSLGSEIGESVAAGMGKAESATESATDRIKEYIVSIEDSIDEINRLQSTIDKGGLSDKEEDALLQKQAYHLANINRLGANKQQKALIEKDALLNAEDTLGLIKSGDFGQQAQDMLSQITSFTDSMQSIINRWVVYNKKRITDDTPEQLMVANDKTGFVLEGKNTQVGGIPLSAIKGVLHNSKDQGNSIIHSHPDEQVAAFSFDDIQAAIGQKVKGIIHQYVVSLNDISFLDISQFTDEQLSSIVEQFKKNAYFSVEGAGDYLDTSKAFETIGTSIDQYIDNILNDLRSFLGNDSGKIDFSSIKLSIQNAIKEEGIDDVEDFISVAQESIYQELDKKNIKYDQSALEYKVTNPTSSKILQSFSESELLKAIQSVAPNVDLSSVYKRTSLENYNSGESLLPPNLGNDKTDVSVNLNDAEDKIKSLESQLQSLREELQRFKDIGVEPEGITELQTKLQNAEQRAESLSSELSLLQEHSIDTSEYRQLEDELADAREEAQSLRDELTQVRAELETSKPQESVDSNALDKKITELNYLYDKVHTIFDGKDGIINEDMTYSEKFDSKEVQRMIELLSQLSDAELRAASVMPDDEDSYNTFRYNLQAEVNAIKEAQEMLQQAYDTGNYNGFDTGEIDVSIWDRLEHIYEMAQEVTSQFNSNLTPAVREFLSLIQNQVGADNMADFWGNQNVDSYINDIINGTKTAKEAFADLENSFGWDTDRFTSLIDGDVPQELQGLYDQLFSDVENRIKSAEQAAEEFNAKLKEIQQVQIGKSGDGVGTEENPINISNPSKIGTAKKSTTSDKAPQDEDTGQEANTFGNLSSEIESVNSELTKKNDLLTQEAQIVDGSIQGEVESFEAIEFAIQAIVEQLTQLIAILPEASFDSFVGQDSQTKISTLLSDLSNLTNILDGIDGQDVFSHLNDLLQSPSTEIGSNIDTITTKFKDLRTVMNGFDDNGSAVFKSLSDLANAGDAIVEKMQKLFAQSGVKLPTVTATKSEDISAEEQTQREEEQAAKKRAERWARMAAEQAQKRAEEQKQIQSDYEANMSTIDALGKANSDVLFAKADQINGKQNAEQMAEAMEHLAKASDDAFNALQRIHEMWDAGDISAEQYYAAYEKYNSDAIQKGSAKSQDAVTQAEFKQIATAVDELTKSYERLADAENKAVNGSTAAIREKGATTAKQIQDRQKELEDQIADKTTKEQDNRIKAAKEFYGRLQSAYEDQNTTAPSKDLGFSPDSNVGKTWDVLIEKAQQYQNILNKQENLHKSLTVNESAFLNNFSDLYKQASENAEQAGDKGAKFLEAMEKAKANIRTNTINNFANVIGNLNATDESMPKAYNDQVVELQQNLEKLKNTDFGSEEWGTTIDALTSGLSKLNNDPNMKQISELSKQKLDRQMSDWINNNSGAGEYLDQVRALQTELQNVASAGDLERIATGFEKVKSSAAEAGKTGASFGEGLMKRFKSLGQYLLSFVSFYEVVGVFKQAIGIVKQLDTALVELKKVSDESTKSYDNFMKNSFDMADKVGTTAQSIISSTADWKRLGESFEEAQKSATTSTVLLNVSEFTNIEDATQSLVSASQAYKDLDKMDIVDKLNNIGNNFSVSTNDLATGLKNAAAVLATQGNDIDQALALLTAGNAVTQDISKTSAGIRTISLRIAGTEEAKDELADMGEDIDDFVVKTRSKTNSIIKDYTAVASNNYQGVSVLDSNGNLRDTYDILLDIAKIYKEIQAEDKKAGTNRAQALIEQLAGKNRSNIAASILMNPEMLEDVYKASQHSQGSAQRELDTYLDSIEAKFAKLQNRLQELAYTSISSDFIKTIVDGLTKAVELATKLIDTMGVLPTILGSIAGFVSFKQKQTIFDMIPGIKDIKKMIQSNDLPSINDIKLSSYQQAIDSVVDLFPDSNQHFDIDFSLSGVETAQESLSDFKYEVVDTFDVAQESALDAGTIIGNFGSSFSDLISGVKAFGAAFGKAFISMAAIMLATKAIQMAASALHDFIHRDEIMIQKGKEATEAITERSKAFKDYKDQLGKIESEATGFPESKTSEESIKKIAKEYDKLHDKVNASTNKNESLSTEDYERYLELSNKIAEQFPSLVKGWDSQGNAILNLGSSADTAEDAIMRLYEAERRAANVEIANNIQASYDGFAKQIEQKESELNSLQHGLDLLNSKAKQNDEMPGGISSLDTLDFNSNIIRTSSPDAENRLREAFATVNEKYNLVLSNITSDIDGLDQTFQVQGFELLTPDQQAAFRESLKTALQHGIESQGIQIADEITNQMGQINTAELFIEDQKKGISSSIGDYLSTSDVFAKQSAAFQNAFLANIGNLDISKLMGDTYSGDIISFMYGEIIEPLYRLQPEAQKAIDGLFRLNPDKTSVWKYINTVQEQLTNAFGQDASSWRQKLGFDQIFQEITNAQLDISNEFKDNKGQILEDSGFDPSVLAQQTLSDLKLYADLVRTGSYDTWEQLQKDFLEQKRRVYESDKTHTLADVLNDEIFKSDVDYNGYESKLSALSSALETLRNEGQLTADTMVSLQQSMPYLTDFSEGGLKTEAFRQLDDWIKRIRQEMSSMSEEGKEQARTMITNMVNQYGDLGLAASDVANAYVKERGHVGQEAAVDRAEYDKKVKELQESLGDEKLDYHVLYTLVASDQFSGTAEDILDKYRDAEIQWHLIIDNKELEEEIQKNQQLISNESSERSLKEAQGQILTPRDYSESLLYATRTRNARNQEVANALAERDKYDVGTDSWDTWNISYLNAQAAAMDAETEVEQIRKEQLDASLNNLKNAVANADAEVTKAQNELAAAEEKVGEGNANPELYDNLAEALLLRSLANTALADKQQTLADRFADDAKHKNWALGWLTDAIASRAAAQNDKTESTSKRKQYYKASKTDRTLSDVLNNDAFKTAIDSKNYESNLSSLTSALETLRTEGSLTAESMLSLQNAMPSLTDFSEDSLKDTAFQQLDDWILRIRKEMATMSEEGKEQARTMIKNMIDSYGDLDIETKDMWDMFLSSRGVDINTTAGQQQAKGLAPIFDAQVEELRSRLAAEGKELDTHVLYTLIASDQFSGTADEIYNAYNDAEVQWHLIADNTELEKQVQRAQQFLAGEDSKISLKEAKGETVTPRDYNFSRLYASQIMNGLYAEAENAKKARDAIDKDVDPETWNTNNISYVNALAAAMDAEAKAAQIEKAQIDSSLNEYRNAVADADNEVTKAQTAIDDAEAKFGKDMADQSLYDALAEALLLRSVANMNLSEAQKDLFDQYIDTRPEWAKEWLNDSFSSYSSAQSDNRESDAQSNKQYQKNLNLLNEDATRTQRELTIAEQNHQKASASTYRDLISNGRAQIENLRAQQHEVENDITAWRNYQDQIESMEDSIYDWSKTMDQLVVTQASELASTLSSAMSEQFSDTGLTSDTMDALLTAFSDLTGNNLDISDAFYNTADGIKVNTQAIEELTEAEFDLQSAQLQEQIDMVQEALERNPGNSALNQKLQQLMQTQAQYFAQYEEMRKALSYNGAMSLAEQTANQGANFDSNINRYSTYAEAYKKGYVGTDDFEAWTAYLDVYGRTGKDIYEGVKDKAERYFGQKKDDSADEIAGLQNFLNDLEKLGYATKSETTPGGYDLKFDSYENASKAMGMGQEWFEDMLGKLEERGFDIMSVSSMADYSLKLQDLQEQQSEAISTYVDMMNRGAGAEDLQRQANLIDEYGNKIQRLNSLSQDWQQTTQEARESDFANLQKNISALEELANATDDVTTKEKYRAEAAKEAAKYNYELKEGSFELTQESQADYDSRIVRGSIENPLSAEQMGYRGQDTQEFQQTQDYIYDIINAEKELNRIREERSKMPAEMVGNVDVNHRPVVLDGDSYHTLLTETFHMEDFGLAPGPNGELSFNITPILPDGTILDQEGVYNYIKDQLDQGKSLEDLDIYMGSFMSDEEASEAAIAAHNAQAEMYDEEAYYANLMSQHGDLSEYYDQLSQYSYEYLSNIDHADGKWSDGEKELEGLLDVLGLSYDKSKMLVDVLGSLGIIEVPPGVTSLPETFAESKKQLDGLLTTARKGSGAAYQIDTSDDYTGKTLDQLRTQQSEVRQMLADTVWDETNQGAKDYLEQLDRNVTARIEIETVLSKGDTTLKQLQDMSDEELAAKFNVDVDSDEFTALKQQIEQLQSSYDLEIHIDDTQFDQLMTALVGEDWETTVNVKADTEEYEETVSSLEPPDGTNTGEQGPDSTPSNPVQNATQSGQNAVSNFLTGNNVTATESETGYTGFTEEQDQTEQTAENVSVNAQNVQVNDDTNTPGSIAKGESLTSEQRQEYSSASETTESEEEGVIETSTAVINADAAEVNSELPNETETNYQSPVEESNYQFMNPSNPFEYGQPQPLQYQESWQPPVPTSTPMESAVPGEVSTSNMSVTAGSVTVSGPVTTQNTQTETPSYNPVPTSSPVTESANANVSIDADTSAIETVTSALDDITDKTVTITVNEEGVSATSQALTAIYTTAGLVDGQSPTITVKEDGVSATSDALTAVYTYARDVEGIDPNVIVNATDNASGKLQTVIDTAQTVESQTPNVNAEATDNASETLETIISNAARVEDSDPNVAVSINDGGAVSVLDNIFNRPPLKEITVVTHYRFDGNPTTSPAAGTFHPAHALGTVKSAFADGTVGEAWDKYSKENGLGAYAGGSDVTLKHDQLALTSEVGQESIVRDGHWYLLDSHPHMEQLKKGDIVFNASQTKDLLEHGRANGHGRVAYANGTAYNSAPAFVKMTEELRKEKTGNPKIVKSTNGKGHVEIVDDTSLADKISNAVVKMGQEISQALDTPDDNTDTWSDDYAQIHLLNDQSAAIQANTAATQNNTKVKNQEATYVDFAEKVMNRLSKATARLQNRITEFTTYTFKKNTLRAELDSLADEIAAASAALPVYAEYLQMLRNTPIQHESSGDGGGGGGSDSGSDSGADDTAETNEEEAATRLETAKSNLKAAKQNLKDNYKLSDEQKKKLKNNKKIDDSEIKGSNKKNAAQVYNDALKQYKQLKKQEDTATETTAKETSKAAKNTEKYTSETAQTSSQTASHTGAVVSSAEAVEASGYDIASYTELGAAAGTDTVTILQTISGQIAGLSTQIADISVNVNIDGGSTSVSSGGGGGSKKSGGSDDDDGGSGGSKNGKDVDDYSWSKKNQEAIENGEKIDISTIDPSKKDKIAAAKAYNKSLKNGGGSSSSSGSSNKSPGSSNKSSSGNVKSKSGDGGVSVSSGSGKGHTASAEEKQFKKEMKAAAKDVKNSYTLTSDQQKAIKKGETLSTKGITDQTKKDAFKTYNQAVKKYNNARLSTSVSSNAPISPNNDPLHNENMRALGLIEAAQAKAGKGGGGGGGGGGSIGGIDPSSVPASSSDKAAESIYDTLNGDYLGEFANILEDNDLIAILGLDKDLASALEEYDEFLGKLEDTKDSLEQLYQQVVSVWDELAQAPLEEADRQIEQLELGIDGLTAALSRLDNAMAGGSTLNVLDTIRETEKAAADYTATSQAVLDAIRGVNADKTENAAQQVEIRRWAVDEAKQVLEDAQKAMDEVTRDADEKIAEYKKTREETEKKLAEAQATATSTAAAVSSLEQNEYVKRYKEIEAKKALAPTGGIFSKLLGIKQTEPRQNGFLSDDMPSSPYASILTGLGARQNSNDPIKRIFGFNSGADGVIEQYTEAVKKAGEATAEVTAQQSALRESTLLLAQAELDKTLREEMQAEILQQAKLAYDQAQTALAQAESEYAAQYIQEVVDNFGAVEEAFESVLRYQKSLDENEELYVKNAEERGNRITAAMRQFQSGNILGQTATLRAEIAALNEELSGDRLIYGSKEWNDLMSQILDKETELNDLLNQQHGILLSILSDVKEHYSVLIDHLEQVNRLNDAWIDTARAIGDYETELSYIQRYAEQQEMVALYLQQSADAQEQFNNLVSRGELVAGTDEYIAKQTEVLSLINDAKNAQNDLREIEADRIKYTIERYEELLDRVDNYVDIIKALGGLISEAAKFDYDTGNLTDMGQASIAIEMTAWQENTEQLRDVLEERQRLRDEFASNPNFGEKEFAEALDANDKQIQEYLSNIKGAADNIVEIGITIAEKQLAAINKTIDARKKALQLEQDYYNYDKSLKNSTKDIELLNAQIRALEGVSYCPTRFNCWELLRAS